MPAREALASSLAERAAAMQESISEYSQIVQQPNPSVGTVVNYARLLLLDGFGKGSERPGLDSAAQGLVAVGLDSRGGDQCGRATG